MKDFSTTSIDWMPNDSDVKCLQIHCTLLVERDGHINVLTDHKHTAYGHTPGFNSVLVKVYPSELVLILLLA
jgi:hypothetical protein